MNISEYTIEKIVKENQDAGLYFFSPATMKAFKSKYYPELIEYSGYILFVTSELDYYGDRVFKVRKFNPKTKNVNSFSEISGEFATKNAALMTIRSFLMQIY